jgi:hypothetical protein
MENCRCNIIPANAINSAAMYFCTSIELKFPFNIGTMIGSGKQHDGQCHLPIDLFSTSQRLKKNRLLPAVS